TKTLSLDGVLLWMSEAAQKILCVRDMSELIGTSWIEFWKGSDREAALAAVRAAAAGGNGNFVGWHAIGGEPRCWDVVITPILDRAGNPEKLLALSRDVTERSKLDEVHSRLAAVVEFSDDAIVSKTLGGIIATWNRGAERMFGYMAEEVIGKPVTILIAPNRVSEESGILARIERGEAVKPYETIRMRKDGTLLHVSLAVSPIKDATGTIIGASKIARDITQQKKAEAERARLARVLEKSLNEIYIFDTEKLCFQYVNQGARRNLGYSMDQMRRMTPLDLKPEFTEVHFRQMIAPLLNGEREKLVFRTVHRRSDSSRYPVEIHLQSVSHAGEVVFMAVTLDITERKKAEEDRERLLALEQAARAKAEEAEVRARFLAEASGSLASTLDFEATMRNIARAAVPNIADWCTMHMVNPNGTVRVVALAHADAAKLAIIERFHTRYPELPGLPIGVEAVLQNGHAQLHSHFSDHLLGSLARDDEHRALLQSLSLSSAMIVPLSANERTLGAITLIAAESGRHFTKADLPFAEDLAARATTAAENARLYQELRHANAAKDHFIAVLSHELRTPLNPVLMTVADLECDESVPQSIREQLTVVRRNVELEARLIDDLLDSTRIASGKLQLYRTIVDATELIRRAVAIVEGEARAKRVRLEVNLCAQPCPVDADPARLQQVIWNVVKNAVKFTPEEGSVRLSCQIEPPGWIRVKVVDNGIGIEAKHLGKIFNAFEQGDLRTGHRFGGLGLGLAISKALVTLHGGSLIAQSDGSGLGATFIIELPLAIPLPVTPISGPLPLASRRPLRLLVVEDHEATSKVMVRLLTKRGYFVTAASSINEALLILEKNSIDLLISDVGLPDGSGRELMEKVRQKQKLPGIALSGYGTEADVAQSNAVGFSVHLTKPVDINRLDHEIQSIFD
ncbi:MAG: hypothetical protein JWL90_1109, partial [Chthoniobacteraceae bacterium]|nr:hypothetical protein [Chthoniobacteraceae bacterium]